MPDLAGPQARALSAAAARQPSNLRVLLVVAPRSTPSGVNAQTASFGLYTALRTQPGFEVFLLTNTPRDTSAPLGTSLHQPWDDLAAFAMDAGECDPFGHHGNHSGLPRAFEALLRRVTPDIVDFHGFPWFGVDALAQVRRVMPACRVVLTLDGEAASEAGMRGTAISALTDGSSRQRFRCNAPDAFLRDMFLRRFLAEVDCLIARGPILAEAVDRWGAPCRRVAVILPDHAQPTQSVPPPTKARGLVVGCFADGLDEEGIGVIHEAEDALSGRPTGARPIRIELHGHIAAPRSVARASVGVSPLVYCEPGEGRDVAAAISGWHAMLIPGQSRNDIPASALTALALGRPVLCGDKGGTSAVVRDGHDGYHFRSCSGVSLADLIDDLAAAPERLMALQPGRNAAAFLSGNLAATLELYRSLAPRDC